MKSSHSKTSYLDYSWHTRLFIRNHWGPWGLLGGPPEPENGQTMPPILRYFFVPPPHKQHPVFPHPSLIPASSHSKRFYLEFSWHIRLSIGSPWGPLMGPWGPNRGWKRPKDALNHQIFLCPYFISVTPCLPTVKSSHNNFFYLDFSLHTRLSIGSPWRPLVACWGPKEPGKYVKSTDIPLTTSHASKVLFSHSQIIP